MLDYRHTQIKQTYKNVNFKLEFKGAFSTNIAILKSLAAILIFSAAILDFHWLFRY